MDSSKDTQSQGNDCLGVVVDTTAPDWLAVHETILAALGHMGLPYRLLDLGRDRLTPDLLTQFRAVLLAQGFED